MGNDSENEERCTPFIPERQRQADLGQFQATKQDLNLKLKRKKAYTNMNCLVITITPKSTLGSWPGRMVGGGGVWGTDQLFEPCDIGRPKSCLTS